MRSKLYHHICCALHVWLLAGCVLDKPGKHPISGPLPLHTNMLLQPYLRQGARPAVLGPLHVRRYGLVEDSEDSDEELLSSEEDPESDMPAGKRPAKGTAARPAMRQIDEDAAMEAGGCQVKAISEWVVSGHGKSFQEVTDGSGLFQGRWTWHHHGQAELPCCNVLLSWLACSA